jgi:hypothetical protein
VNQGDSLKFFWGTFGTLSSMALADAETAAAIFAGLATGLFMLVSIYFKIFPRKK